MSQGEAYTGLSGCKDNLPAGSYEARQFLHPDISRHLNTGVIRRGMKLHVSSWSRAEPWMLAAVVSLLLVFGWQQVLMSQERRPAMS